MEDYEKNARELLKKLGVSFKAKYLKTAKYFDNDTEQRDVYTITLSRGERSYTFTFGQSIQRSGKYHATSAYGKRLNNGMTVIKGEKFNFSSSENPQLLLDYRKNYNYAVPNEYDVLACLEKYDPGTFDDFCHEFGYDNDSRKVESIYTKVKEQFAQLQRLFTEEEIDMLREIQ